MDRNAYDANEAMAQYAARAKAKREHIQNLRETRRKRAQVSMRWMLLRAVVYVVVGVTAGATVFGLYLAGAIV